MLVRLLTFEAIFGFFQFVLADIVNQIQVFDKCDPSGVKIRLLDIHDQIFCMGSLY